MLQEFLYKHLVERGRIDSRHWASSVPPKSRWEFFRDYGVPLHGLDAGFASTWAGQEISDELADGKVNCAKRKHRAAINAGLELNLSTDILGRLTSR